MWKINTSLSDTLKNFQTGELVLLATAELRSAVECPFATHAGGKSRAINLRHVIVLAYENTYISRIVVTAAVSKRVVKSSGLYAGNYGKLFVV